MSLLNHCRLDWKKNIISGLVYRNKKFDSMPNEESGKDPIIFNSVSSAQNPITWHDFLDKNQKFGNKVPSTLMIWYHFVVFVQCHFLLGHLQYNIYKFLLHIVPGAIMDLLAKMSGQPAM